MKTVEVVISVELGATEAEAVEVPFQYLLVLFENDRGEDDGRPDTGGMLELKAETIDIETTGLETTKVGTIDIETIGLETTGLEITEVGTIELE